MTSNRFSNRLNQYFKDNIRVSFVERNVILVVTKEDKVYEFEKDMFRNALFTTSDNKAVVDSFVEKSLAEELCGKGVTDFSSGDYHKIARTGDGKIYCWGRNEQGVLGNGRVDKKVYKPTLNEYLSNKNVTNVCCVDDHSLALTIDGEVYAWGGNYEGQIGNGEDGEWKVEVTPYRVRGFDGEKVTAIACGRWHSMVLTETGKVYSWGSNSYGQLGLGIKYRNCNSPKQIEMNGITTKKICCGAFHGILLSCNGHIYMFGENDFGQLGTDVNSWRQFTPKMLVHSSKFTDIASHWRCHISAAQSENGSYYIWGNWGEKIVKPKETTLKSFDNIFAHFLQVNYKLVEGKIITFSDTFIQNGEYKRWFNELEELGEGCFGRVFKVERNKEFYAVKKIRFSTDKEKKFLKELETCAMIQKLSDVRLVRYHEVWVENLITDEFRLKDCTLYIQMELCEKNLRRVIDEMIVDSNISGEDCLTPLGYFVASKLFIETLKGVKYLHQHNLPVIHRDLKPDNILLKIRSNRRPFVKIGDFGLAAFHEFARQSHSAYGGAAKYAAPEVLSGRNYDTKADIYSLGVVAEELFHFDINMDYSNHFDGVPPVLRPKYEAIMELSVEMRHLVFGNRPDCRNIAKSKNSWALNASEFDVRQELDNLKKSTKYKNSYIFKIIKHVL